MNVRRKVGVVLPGQRDEYTVIDESPMFYICEPGPVALMKEHWELIVERKA